MIDILEDNGSRHILCDEKLFGGVIMAKAYLEYKKLLLENESTYKPIAFRTSLYRAIKDLGDEFITTKVFEGTSMIILRSQIYRNNEAYVESECIFSNKKTTNNLKKSFRCDNFTDCSKSVKIKSDNFEKISILMKDFEIVKTEKINNRLVGQFLIPDNGYCEITNLIFISDMLAVMGAVLGARIDIYRFYSITHQMSFFDRDYIPKEVFFITRVYDQSGAIKYVEIDLKDKDGGLICTITQQILILPVKPQTKF